MAHVESVFTMLNTVQNLRFRMGLKDLRYHCICGLLWHLQGKELVLLHSYIIPNQGIDLHDYPQPPV